MLGFLAQLGLGKLQNFPGQSLIFNWLNHLEDTTRLLSRKKGMMWTFSKV